VIGLQGHDLPYNGIEKIKHIKDPGPYFMMNPLHESCENKRYSARLRLDSVNSG
jgi:hypothetical protein